MISLKRILVPTDFSEPSMIAVRYAKELARTFNASLQILHVMEDPNFAGWTVHGYSPTLPGVLKEIENHASDSLNEIFTQTELQELHVELIKKWGVPFVEIIRHAKTQETDLIVMGTHGRGAIKHILLGSVAERVVRKANCPVMTVRHPEHEFVMP